ncbi:nucleotide exchange factor GrpE [Microtetraspora sp. AC03309]|uniref:nucleotide exchange factor GrpE n=1 Tax=Microtetraspora sp. AC03309 TaxID=2779376 RepID=UPI000772F024|nr:nucleotide exchange factor GrpE [Microtetraspora sp. AC03309]MCC5580228.1 nucleotide exchange factor GrpE [Microtetraspora sp. AC03309]
MAEREEGRPGGHDENRNEVAENEVDERVAELEGRWLRAVAELDTVRRRMAGDVERQRMEERTRVAAEWLPVLDNLELALRHAGDGALGPADAVIEGVRAVRDQAVAVLSRLGFPRQDVAGQKFDPALHEAVGAVPDRDAAPGTIVEVVRPGYGDAEHLLRPASVVVSTKAD